MSALDAITDWPVRNAAAAVMGPSGVLTEHGDVRRRFAFVTVMPDRQVPNLPAAVEIFDRLAAVFVEHASDDMLHLLPGHAYFIADNDAELRNRFRYELLPLIDEYLRQGLMGQAASDLYAVRDQISDFASA